MKQRKCYIWENGKLNCVKKREFLSEQLRHQEQYKLDDKEGQKHQSVCENTRKLIFFLTIESFGRNYTVCVDSE